MTAADEVLHESAGGSAPVTDTAKPRLHEPRRDGYMEYLFHEDGVYLCIQPPQGGGRAVTLEELKKELKKRGLESLMSSDDSLLAVYRSRGKPVRVSGPLFDVEKKDGYFSLEVSRDGLEAHLRVELPWGGEPVTFENVKAAMAQKGIAYGIDEEALLAALREAREEKSYKVAQGFPPEHGKDAELEYFFDTNAKGIPKELEDGRVDYRELNLVVSVSKGTLLARKTPPEDGKPGTNVYGREIPAKRGRDLVLPAGKGVERSEDGMNFYAAADGCPVATGKQIKVLPVYEIPGDVDFSTGNVYFMGNIVVRGYVRSGFKIFASGNVEVLQGVEDAKIEAEGKVLVKRGISGRGKAFIKAGGDVMAKFIQHAEVRTKESVSTEACLHSTIYARTKMSVGGKRGLIVGGLIRVGEEVSALTVGSPFATPTEIEIGIDPDLREELLRLSHQIETDTENLKNANKGIEHLSKTAAAGGSLSQEKIALIDRLRKTKRQIEERLVEMKEKRQAIREKIFQEPSGRLRVKNVLHPGVKVSFKQASQQIKEEKHGVCLVEVEGEIKEGAA